MIPTTQMLKVTQLHKSYGARSVLRGVSFQVEQGELVGIVGENGTGKTTLLRILCGQLRPDQGTVSMHGSLGYCPQYPVLNEELTVNQHLRYFQIAYRLANLRWADELIDRLGFSEYRNSVVKILSGGTKQKLNLVLALMHDPEVILLDEPYQGFDWETYLRFWDIAIELRKAGRAVVVISHLAYDTNRLDTLYRLQAGTLDYSVARKSA